MFSIRVQDKESLNNFSWVAFYGDGFSKAFWYVLNLFSPATMLTVVILSYPYMSLAEVTIGCTFVLVIFGLSVYVAVLTERIHRNLTFKIAGEVPEPLDNEA
jgi:hypothetical protein